MDARSRLTLKPLPLHQKADVDGSELRPKLKSSTATNPPFKPLCADDILRAKARERALKGEDQESRPRKGFWEAETSSHKPPPQPDRSAVLGGSSSSGKGGRETLDSIAKSRSHGFLATPRNHVAPLVEWKCPPGEFSAGKLHLLR